MPPTIPSNQPEPQQEFTIKTIKEEPQDDAGVQQSTSSNNLLSPIKTEPSSGISTTAVPLRPLQSITPPTYRPHLSLEKCDEFEFEVPEEAPVFVPTMEEFKNPLLYIAKIRPIGEKFGIVKIKPPADWQPPFDVDVENLRFTPRVQRLNELEAKTRIKLNFLDQIAKFWELQGNSLKIPMVERKALDLYSLHRIVQEEGGLEVTTKERKWSKVANRMGYPVGKNVGTILKGHYERILYPFDIYTSGKIVDGANLETGGDSDDCDYKPHCIMSRQQVKPPTETTARRSKRFTTQSPTATTTTEDFGEMNLSKDKTISAEMRRKNSSSSAAASPKKEQRSIKRESAQAIEQDPLAKYICHVCNRGDYEEAMLLCDGCDDSYHTFCLMPPLTDIPKGDWRCPKCVVQEVSKPIEAFGFEQANREYTLHQFGEMADQFKADYFNMPVHLVPTELVEKEFWRITSSIDEDVTVEYGADLHTMDHGSGFPTKNSLYIMPDDQKYAESNWNLNNLPLLEESILGYINADISGMKIPWMYVGMCFATFCWHIEDHWSYSINYLHWGEPKTWYGVPGSSAETLESTMKRAAPELFENQPDLLHQLVTIMNPNILMAEGVPVYRCDQRAGEFIVTFPRAYHAGFNQGYNFAEAVNFAPADWMKLGRECIDHYSKMRRFCVFSHDELVCKMALESDRLNLGIATACYLDMVEMIDIEKKLRKSLLDWGVIRAAREAFELLVDDERQCDYCKTTCFLSAVTCECTKQLVCLRHFKELCKCPADTHTLKYRYTLDELPLMLKKLKSKAESFEKWLKRVRDVLDPSSSVKINFEDLQELAQEAEQKRFPKSLLLERLNSAMTEAEKCITVIQQLDINKIRTRTRHSNDFAKYKLTLDELDLFVQEIDNLCCIIDDGISVKELQQMGYEFVANVKRVLNDECLTENLPDEISQLVQDGNSLCIELPQLDMLKARLEQVQWYRSVRAYREKKEVHQLVALKKLLSDGMKVPPHYIIEKQLSELQDMIQSTETWEENVSEILVSNIPIKLEDIEELLQRGKQINCYLPSFAHLKEAMARAKECLDHLETLQQNENYPYLETLEYIINRARSLPFQLEPIQKMEEHVDEARSWKDRACQTFLKKNSKFTLLEALTPKYDSDLTFAAYPPTPSPVASGNGDITTTSVPASFRSSDHASAPASSPISSSTSSSSTISAISSGSNGSTENSYIEDLGPAIIVATFKKAEENEVTRMTEIRRKNSQKHPERDQYCLCKGRFSGIMYHCQLCLDWFHSSCVPVPKHCTQGVAQRKQSHLDTDEIAHIQLEKYLCPLCQRTKRPKLETILALLVALQKIPLRVPEGEALQCVTERAMHWQDRVKQALFRKDIALALAKLSVQHQKKNEADQQQQSDTISSKSQRNSRKTATNLKKFKKLMAAANSSLNKTDQSDTDKVTDKLGNLTPSSSETSSDQETLSDICDEQDELAMGKTTPEHAYSIMCKQMNPNTPTNGPLIQLSRATQEFLEELMMEGDLLEVTLDETIHLWQILSSSRERINELEIIYKKFSIPNEPPYHMFNEDNYKKRKYFDTGYGGVPMKKPNKIKDERRGSQDNASRNEEDDDVDDHDSEMENDNLPAGANQSAGIKGKKQMMSAGGIKTGKTSGKLKMMKPKRGRKYKVLKDKNQDGCGGGGAVVQSKYKRKKISAVPNIGAPTATNILSPNVTGNLVISSALLSSAPNSSIQVVNKRQVKKDGATGKGKTGKKSKLSNNETITSDEDEVCSVSNCARPSGSEVDWVQCDGGCNKWFHMYCVGLDKTQIKPDVDFICNSCKKVTAPAVSSVTAESITNGSSCTTTTSQNEAHSDTENGGVTDVPTNTVTSTSSTANSSKNKKSKSIW